MKVLTLPAVQENIPAVIDFVNRELESLGCSMKIQSQIDIAIDEICSNIANYGYEGGSGVVDVRIETEHEPHAVTIAFADSGTPFNPLERGDPNVTLKARERKIGGLGIFMVKKSMDDVRYEYREGRNILTIRKMLP